MRFRKLTVLVSLFVVCFVLAAQSAKADDILFNDLTDTLTVTNLQGGTVTPRLTFTCPSGLDSCTATLAAPSLFPGSVTISSIIYRLGEGSTTGNLSDTLVGLPVLPLLRTASLTFSSNLSTVLGEANGLGPCVVLVLFPSGCNAAELGTPQLAGTITWKTSLVGGVTTGTDNIWVVSDPVPEPASLILFGSGLAIAGGFLRRRCRQAVTLSV